MDRVRETEGGEVRVLSSMHESGKRLEGLSGVAAILTFPLEDLDLADGEGGQDIDGDNEVQQNGVEGVEGRSEALEDFDI